MKMVLFQIQKKKQLKRELNVMKKVKHPNVIELIEYLDDVKYPEADGSKKSCIVTVLEFAPGGELFDFLMFTGCFSEEAARTYLYQFLNGLEAMHKLGIAHRDLKPENLLMDADYNLKIADFGFATEFLSQDGSQIMMQTACGTKGYLAPELLKGKKYTQKCDLFAVGIILFTTYAGFPPFQNAVDTDWWWEKLLKGWGLFESAKTTEDKKEKATMEQKSKEKFELFWKAHERSRQFSDDLKELCVNILHPNPKMRYDIPDVRKHQWYRGKIYNTEEIKKYMEKRIRLVMKERALKVKKQAEEQHLTSVSKNYIVRGDNLKSEIQKRVETLDPNNEFNKYLDHLKDDTFVNTYYRFLTFKKPNEVAARIERIADRLHSEITFAPSQHIIMIRSTVTFDNDTSEEDIVIAVKQFIYDGTDSQENANNNNNNDDTKESINNQDINVNENLRYIVAFKRLKGSPITYQQVVEQFYNADDIVDIMDTADIEELSD